MDYGPYFSGPAPAGMRVVTDVPPAVEPVTLADAKLYGNIDNPADDPIVTRLIVAVREYVETEARLAFITQTKTLYLGGFPSAWSQIQLPYPPLQSIVSVAYTGMDGSPVIADPAGYIFTPGSIPGRVWLPLGTVWPITAPFPDSVRITYTCGYGDTAAAVPMAAWAAIASMVAANYPNREAVVMIQGGTMVTTPLYDRFIRSLNYGFYG